MDKFYFPWVLSRGNKTGLSKTVPAHFEKKWQNVQHQAMVWPSLIHQSRIKTYIECSQHHHIFSMQGFIYTMHEYFGTILGQFWKLYQIGFLPIKSSSDFLDTCKMSHLKAMLKYNGKWQLGCQQSMKTLNNLKEFNILAALPRDIEITENGRPEP